MPVNFLTAAQRERFGRYAADPAPKDIARYFHLTEDDKALIASRRGEHSRLGFAVQLGTVRFLGTFLEDQAHVPASVLEAVGRQLGISNLGCIQAYQGGEQRLVHAAEIKSKFGYLDFTDPVAGLRLSRWLYSQCWTGTDRPSVLFDRATDWLLAHKVLLPGVSVLERFVARVRSRVESRLYQLLEKGLASDQQTLLEDLLRVPEGGRMSMLEQLRTGPFTVSGPSLVRALRRLEAVRNLGVALPATARIPPNRIASLARFANTAKVTALARLRPERRIATLAAFVHCLEATAQDEALEVLEMLLRNLFSTAEKAQRKVRLRTLKDLDEAAATLVEACRILLDQDLSEGELRSQVFSKTTPADLQRALDQVEALIRPPDDVFYQELEGQYRSVRRYLPTVLKCLRFEASPAGKDIVAAFDWLRIREEPPRPGGGDQAPREIVTKPWRRHVLRENGGIDVQAYTFCVLDRLHCALKRRDVFVNPSWRYADPRAGLLEGAEWESARPVVCRTLGLSPDAGPVLSALSEELDQTYAAVAARLPANPAVRFEMEEGKKELFLTPLDELEASPSLEALRKAVAARLPRVDLPEILLEMAARTEFLEAFTHVAESTARAADLGLSLCTVLLAEACNTGLESLVRNDVPALRRDRLSWVSQNYVRDETLALANARLVAFQNRIALAHAWGGGEVASADGQRFVVPVRTVYAGPNPKYFGVGRGITHYNLVSNQYTGLNAITVPGTMRDSLILLAVVLEQQTDLQPVQIMTDSGAYRDVVFGLFRLLGYRFSPRLADIGGTRFWRIEPKADYGELNTIARQRINLNLIAQHWDDLLRLAGSLKLGRVPAAGIMRTLQVGDRPTRLAQALAEFGRIDKTLHSLTYLDDEDKRRGTLLQLNRGEGRHALARTVFHGKRGELRQRYRAGQEDQLGALGLVVNVIVLWNTIYTDAALAQLHQEGFPVHLEDVARLSPLTHDHINMLGRYSFVVPDAVARGELRPLRDPNAED